MNVVFIVTGDAINITIDGKMEVLRKSHENYDKIVKLLKEAQAAGKDVDLEKLKNLINPAEKFRTFSQGCLKIENGKIYYIHDNGNGPSVEVMVDNSLISRIETMIDDGFTPEPLVKFYTNLMNNPSNRAVTGFYKFLDKHKLPLTDDGCFYAYKKVRHNYKDIYTGKIDNSVGNTVDMMRNQVDDDFRNTCSYGLHFASFEYARDFYTYFDSDDRMLVLKINPADVVAFPNDHNDQKGRCCRYEVFKEIPNDKMEYLLKDFQGVESFDECREIISFVRETFFKHGSKVIKEDLRIDTAIGDKLHKTKVKKILKDIYTEYDIEDDVEFTGSLSINNVVKFICREVDLEDLRDSEDSE